MTCSGRMYVTPREQRESSRQAQDSQFSVIWASSRSDRVDHLLSTSGFVTGLCLRPLPEPDSRGSRIPQAELFVKEKKKIFLLSENNFHVVRWSFHNGEGRRFPGVEYWNWILGTQSSSLFLWVRMYRTCVLDAHKLPQCSHALRYCGHF